MRQHALDLIEFNKNLILELNNYLQDKINDDLKVSLIQQSAKVHLQGTGEFVSPELELLLLQLAKNLSIPQKSGLTTNDSKQRWAHVATSIFDIGGHTAFMKRWIENSNPNQIHSVILINQLRDVPEEFVSAVKQKGGNITIIQNNIGKMAKAQLLRNISCNEADIVVLHTHPDDPVPVIAYGVPIDPPVLLFNHSDHTFWFGASIADLVINFRESSIEFNKKHRGIDRNQLLPLPIPIPSELMSKKQARQLLRLPEDSLIFLTVGRSSKYDPLPGLNFPKTLEGIFTNLPDAIFIAVGPKLSGDWIKLKESIGIQLMIPGSQVQLEPFYRSADIYLEGFPISSATALLEAASFGLAIVRAPQNVPLPYYMDDPCFDNTPRPKDFHAFIGNSIELAMDEEKRRVNAAYLQKSIVAQHCSPHWDRFLENIHTHLPKKHQIYSIKTNEELDNDLNNEFFILRGGAGFGKVLGYENVCNEIYEKNQTKYWIKENASKVAKQIFNKENRNFIVENLQIQSKRHYFIAIQYYIRNPRDYRFFLILLKSLIPFRIKKYLRMINREIAKSTLGKIDD